MADNKLLDVEILTPQKVIYSGKAISVSVPGSLSPFQVLYNHAPIVSSLDFGIVKIVNEDNSKIFFAIQEGFTEVRSNRVSILVDSALNAEMIDINSANEELKKALDDLSEVKTSIEKNELKKKIIQTKILIKAYNKQKGIE